MKGKIKSRGANDGTIDYGEEYCEARQHGECGGVDTVRVVAAGNAQAHPGGVGWAHGERGAG
jgi:hypothetical protein